MKRQLSPSLLRISTIAAVLVFALSACENPFQLGLGDKVDLDVPDVAITSHDAGAYVRGQVTFAGVFTDDFEVSSVKISLNNGASLLSATLDQAARTWRYTVDTASYPDGETDVLMQVTDATGKSIEKRQLHYVDNGEPLVLVTIPQSYASNSYNGEVTVRGEAADQFGISLVEYRILDASDAPVTGWAPADGTNSWAFLFDSTASVPATGQLQAEIRATDRAGNQSTSVLHYDDILPLNSSQSITVEALRIIADGGSVSGPTITRSDIDGIRFAGPAAFPISIDQSLDEPSFVVSNPDENSAIDQNVRPANDRLTGTVEDDAEGIDTSPGGVQFRIYSDAEGSYMSPSTGNPIVGDGWTNVTSTDGTGLLVRWSAQYTGLTDGDYHVQLRAYDVNGVEGISNTVAFRVDSGAPGITVSSPSQGAYVNDSGGTFGISGTASDPGGIASVEVSVDNGTTWLPVDALAATVPTASWSIEIDPATQGMTDGSRTVKIRASDNDGSTGTYNLQIVLDTQLPSGGFISPTFSSSVNGEVIIRGTANDNTQVANVELRIGLPDTWIEPTGLYNWTYTIDSTSYANSSYATETSPGSEVWQLPVDVRVTDVSGNQRVQTGYYFFIDNDLDKPTVAYVSPSEGQRIAGPVLVSGTAFDDDAVAEVRMQIDVNNDGDYLDLADLNGDGDTTDLYEDETAVEVLTGTTLWSRELNNGGALYNADGGTGTVRVKVWAVDINGLAGNAVERAMQFDDTIPRAENLNLSSGDYVGGTFTLTADILDDVQIKSVKISYNGGQDYVDLVAANEVVSGHAADITKNSQNSFSLSVDIDTDGPQALYGLAGPIDSDILYLRLRIEDEANYQSISYINLNVDNLYPTGAWNSGAVDPLEIDGSAARVQGTAEDFGTVSGISAAHVYFIRGTQVFNPATGASTAVGSADFSNGGGAVISVPYPSDSLHRIEIDDPNEFGSDISGNGDGDGYNESLTISGSTFAWWAEFDSRQIPDGAIEIHYVVFDSAGNGTHYQEAGFIKNHRPTISGLTVGTDVDFSGAVEADERFVYSILFDASRYLYVGVEATDVTGTNPGIASYEVVRAADASVVQSAATGTISIISYPESTGPADSEIFSVTVTDNDGIQASTNFTVRVDNDDTVAPTAALDPFTVASVVDGHVEPVGEATDFAGYDRSSTVDATADVSGTVAVSGTASDDQRIQAIYLTISGYDGGAGSGTEFQLAQWDPADGRLEYSSGPSAGTALGDTLNAATGHDTSFRYEWNSADVIGVAVESVSIGVRVTDFGAGPGEAIDTLGVDVVPYISSISRTDGIVVDRTRLGRFPLAEGATTVRLNGFNLNPDWVRVYNSAGTTFDALTVGASGAPYTTVDLNLDTTFSGYLWMSVNGVVSTNNINDNDADNNKEDDGSGIGSTRWNDDRYVQLWDVDNDFQGSGDAERAAMTVDADGTQYAAWSNYTNSASYYGTDGQVQNHYTTYDPPEWNDLAFNTDSGDMFIVHLRNFFNGGDQWGSLVMNAFEPNPIGVDTEAAIIDDLDNVLYQYRNPRIAVKPDATNPTRFSIIYVSYYDANTDELKFSSWRYDNQGGNSLTTRTTGTNIVVDTAGDVGLWSDIGVDADGNPFIVYYDTTNQRLKIARAADDDPDSTGEWSVAAVDAGAQFYGEYVSVAVDTGGTVHLSAYQNSTGDLVYYSAPHVASPGQFSFTRSVVDTPDAVGTWSEVSVIGTTPHIVYINESQAGTFYGLRYAYHTGTEWETATVPVQVAIASARTGIGAKPVAASLPVADDYVVSLGYGGGSYYFARLRPEQ